ncbi:uncharacterized protein LOC135266661 [Tribolium castaneum]|uniref:uncharacterized protein LOC135266661 n=1 Tax=Tribolium castaneum TaxID=7070 RepID=UPI0030FEDD7A
MKFQVMILNNWIEEMTKNQVVQAQEKIRQKLIFFIRRHDSILTFWRNKLKQMRDLIVVFIPIAVFLFISILTFMFTGSFYREYYLRLALSCATAIAAFGSLLFFGQKLENEIERLATVTYNLEWYNFDLKNRKIYCFFLLNAMKPFQIEHMGLAINHQLGLSVMRTLYSAVSFTLKIMDSKLKDKA